MPATYDIERAIGGVNVPYTLRRGASQQWIEMEWERRVQPVDPGGDFKFLVGATLSDRPQDVGIVPDLAGGSYADALNYHVLKTGHGDPRKLEIRRNYDTGMGQNFFTGNNGNNRLDYPVGGPSIRTTHHSFHTTQAQMADLASGPGATFDAAFAPISNLLYSAPTDHSIIWTANHEPEDNWDTAELKAQYKAGTRAMYAAMKAHPQWTAANGRWRTCWVMMAYSWNYSPNRDPSEWDPGYDVVDIAGADTYNEGSLGQTAEPHTVYWDPPQYELGIAIAGAPRTQTYFQGGFLSWIAAHGYTKYLIAEVGCIRNIQNKPGLWIPAGYTNSKADWIKLNAKFHYDYSVSGAGARCVAWEYFDPDVPNARNFRGTGWTQSPAAAHTMAHWSATKTYASGDFAEYSWRQMQSKVAGNVGHTPTVGGNTYWTDVRDSTEAWELRWTPAVGGVLPDYAAVEWVRDTYGMVA